MGGWGSSEGASHWQTGFESNDYELNLKTVVEKAVAGRRSSVMMHAATASKKWGKAQTVEGKDERAGVGIHRLPQLNDKR